MEKQKFMYARPETILVPVSVGQVLCLSEGSIEKYQEETADWFVEE